MQIQRDHFNGRIVVVKSTDTGGTDAFEAQDNLYTVCVRGLGNGTIVEQNIICSAISRVLSAKNNGMRYWKPFISPSSILLFPITTEVGLQLVKEKVLENIPVSFPGNTACVLHERYMYLKDHGIIVIPTELISDNGEKLRSIIHELVLFNDLGSNSGDGSIKRLILQFSC
jgi:tagaturonate reductase